MVRPLAHPMDGIGVYIPGAVIGPALKVVAWFCPACRRNHYAPIGAFKDTDTFKFSSECSEKVIGRTSNPVIVGFDVVIEELIMLPD